ncbi:conserved hypothetical protein [Gloeothece citriformis PCC 7424]|uniref:Chromophore lyase CpcT/CpeT n=1 Tax=Gloeothece citriformis (strain PCC 7424) TaxID=65393 RepID=B7KLF4_GLOC7|nr:chromophore lyase CpcT/CpeT [Gloeothece citriformis]ACK72526.1 conserved hypothetical protein [Gloeothece citriformis PCC 7424]
MRQQTLTIGLLVSYLLTTASAQAVPVQTHINSVVSHLVGVMDTSAQVAKNPNKANVRMTTCQVTLTGGNDSIYLYQEQALTKTLDKPYRQRFLEIKPTLEPETVESKSYKPLQAERLIGFCNKPLSERVLNVSELGEPVCSVFLKPSNNGYLGETQPEGCPANVRGAVTITNTILLHSEGMDTWDKGYDAQGNQVWGANDDPFEFRWLEQKR